MSRRPQQDSLEAMKETLAKLRAEGQRRIAMEAEEATQEECLDANESDCSSS